MSLTVPARKVKDYYQEDFFKWTKKQARLLEEGAFKELDVPNLIEEIESLGRNDKRALKSQLTRLLMQLLKQKYQSEKQKNSNSWTNSIVEAEREIRYFDPEDSPSFKNELKKILPKSYEDARQDVSRETGLVLTFSPKSAPGKCKKSCHKAKYIV